MAEKLFEPGNICAIERNAERKTKVVLQCFIVQFLQFSYIFKQDRWEANTDPSSVDLAFIQRREFNSCKTFSFNVTASTKTGVNLCNSEMCHVNAVPSGCLNLHVLTSCRSAGPTMAPQNSGNGPDGAHPPITRSPMAQERGMCICVLATGQHFVFGLVWRESREGCQSTRSIQRLMFVEWKAVCVRACVWI